MIHRVLVLGLVTCVLASSASAALVDWSALSWPAGSLSNSYDVDPSSSGSDGTVTVSGDTGQLQPSLASSNLQQTDLRDGPQIDFSKTTSSSLI